MKKTTTIKIKLLLFLFLTTTTTVNSFGQTWLWANSAGGTDYDIANSVIADASGNVIAAGDFYSSTITFGSTTLTNAGFGDMFIVKYNAAGNVLWATSAGGGNEDRTSSVTIDASGNIIATGYFRSDTITFGSTNLINAGGGVGCSAGCADMYIVKYDTAGNVLWAKSTGGTLYDVASSVTADTSGNIIVEGGFNSPTITFGSTTLTNTGSFDIYIVKYDTAGNVLWARAASGTDWDYGSVTADASGNIIAAGAYLSPTITFGSTTLTNAGAYDMFIVKYDTAGNVLWTNSAGGTASDGASSIAADPWGNLIALGTFGSPTITFGSTTLINTGFSNMFIVKYDTAGNALWAKAASGSPAGVESVTTDAVGNIIAAGAFYSAITFGSTTLTNADISGTSLDLFIVKYDTAGNVLWANSAGGTFSDAAYSVTADISGNIIAAGLFASPAVPFGATTLLNADNTGNTYDLFIAKLDITTGIHEITNDELQITIYPNPGSGVLTIEFNSEEQNGNQLILMNTVGQIVYSETFKNNSGNQTKTLDVSDLPNGIYFMKLYSAGKYVSKKIIID